MAAEEDIRCPRLFLITIAQTTGALCSELLAMISISNSSSHHSRVILLPRSWLLKHIQSHVPLFQESFRKQHRLKRVLRRTMHRDHAGAG